MTASPSVIDWLLKSDPANDIGYFPLRLHWAKTLSSGLFGN